MKMNEDLGFYGSLETQVSPAAAVPPMVIPEPAPGRVEGVGG